MSDWQIYGLREAGSSEIGYVGLTTVGLHLRLRRHRHRADGQGSTYHVHNWMRSVGTENIEIVSLESCPEGDLEYLYAAESRWEQRLREAGHQLRNSVPCGYSNPRMSGESHPLYGIGHRQDSKNKISKNHADVSGSKNPNYGKGLSGAANPNYGVKTSPEKAEAIRRGQRESVKVHARLHEQLNRRDPSCAWCCYELLYGVEKMSSFD